MCVFFFLTGDNSYLSTVQIIDSLGPRRVQVDRGGSAGCAGLPEIYRDSSIPRGERGKYAIRVGRTVAPIYIQKLIHQFLFSFFSMLQYVSNEWWSVFPLTRKIAHCHEKMETVQNLIYYFFARFKLHKEEMKTDREFCLLTEPWDESLTWTLRAYSSLSK